MEAFGQIPSAGRRRMARVYSDNKRSNELVTGEQETVPELVALHMEFKIQRERLSAWGKEWGDDRVAAEGNLEESFARAELTDAVTDVLQNIRRILDETERIQYSNNFKLGSGGVSLAGEKTRIWGESGGERRWSQEDRSRYEELAEELKNSIDLLYDISTNRKEIREGTYPASGKGKSEPAREASVPPSSSKSSTKSFFLGSYNTSQETLVNATRNTTWSSTQSSMQKTASSLELPPRLDPAALELPEEEPPPYDSVGATPSTRMIASLRQPTPPSSSLSEDFGTVSVPVLIEYASYDPAYRSTGVSVPTNRLDAFMSFYARCSSLVDFPQFGTLSCLGYFEDPKEARFGLVYELPQRVLEASRSGGRKIDLRPISLIKVLQSASKSLNSSNRTLPPGPPLEDRFRLAFNVMQSFSKLHNEEHMVHKDINSSNVMFFTKASAGTGNNPKHDYDVRTPYMSSFDLFSEYSIEALSTAPGRNLYRRPDDPRIFQGICEFCSSRSCKCPKYRFDIYGLGLLLLEIGMWVPLSDVFKPRYTLADFKKRVEEIWVKKLASRCGTVYMNVVRDLLQQSSQNLTEGDLHINYERWLRRLQKCCSLDEDDSHFDAGFAVARARNFTGVPASTSPEVTFLASQEPLTPTQASLPQLQSNNPFVSLQAAPTSTSFFSNPFSRFSSNRTSIYSIREAGEESKSLPVTPQPDDASETTTRDFSSVHPRSDIDNTSISSTATKYQKAAKIIQRAWRCRGGKDSFQEYKRKITVLQKQWRKRQQLCGAREAALTPKPGTQTRESVQDFELTQIQVRKDEIPVKPKLRIQCIKTPVAISTQWYTVILPQLERIVSRTLKDSPESASIDLFHVGETERTARPTIFITCESTRRVKCAISRKFNYDHEVFDVKIRRGSIRRSKATRPKKPAPPHRSMANEADWNNGNPSLNAFHQERPLCGASIGAYVDNKHLPPVSYGGVIRVDGEPYGMTVHHILDSPSDDESSEFDEEENAIGGAERSSARRSDGFNQWLAGMASHPTLQTVPTDSMFPLEISDDDEPSSEEEGDEFDYSDEEGFPSSDEESEDDGSIETQTTERTQGDSKGIIPGGGCNIFITQPALDDVDEDFFPTDEDKDDDHLASHKLGHVHASSGIRRWNRKGVVHEIDWALLKLEEQRLQPYNLVQGGRKHLKTPGLASRLNPKLLEPICRGKVYKPEDDEFPVKIARNDELADLRVHCFGRTSGLQGGVVSSVMSSVRIYRRRSFSRSWHVVGNFGVGGDSGAWVIDNEQGRVCGHVLAWCESKAIAYICPMEILLEDIRKTLGARKITLPGSEEDVIVSMTALQQNAKLLDEKSASAEGMELPDIARLDFGDRERLGLGDGRDMIRSSHMPAVRMRGRMEYPGYLGAQRQIA